MTIQWRLIAGRRQSVVGLGLLLGLGLALPSIAQSLPVRVDRWLEVESLDGSVQFLRQQQVSPARLGLRLSRVGEGLQTRRRSSARLALDTQIGFVNLAENTSLRIEGLQTVPSGGRITQLYIEQGQARLQTRPFTDPSTRFDLRTPAGITSIRGTVFGVAVQASGQTGVAAEVGAVEVSAQGKSVMVNAGFQSLVVPGEPPTEPQPLTDDPSLDLRELLPDGDLVQIVGRTDPINLLLVDEQQQPVAANGEFSLELPVPLERRIRATVVTPLGSRQTYEIQVP